MSLASKVSGYDSKENNKLFAKEFKKSTFQKLSLCDLQKLLHLACKLNLRASAIEKLELHIMDLFEKRAEEVKENEFMLLTQMMIFRQRRKLS